MFKDKADLMQALDRGIALIRGGELLPVVPEDHETMKSLLAALMCGTLDFGNLEDKDTKLDTMRFTLAAAYSLGRQRERTGVQP